MAINLVYSASGETLVDAVGVDEFILAGGSDELVDAVDDKKLVVAVGHEEF